MVRTLIGTKVRQSQQFTEDGTRIPVTVIDAGSCFVVGIMQSGSARRVQIGVGTTRHIKRSTQGTLKKAGIDKKPRFLRVVDLSGEESPGVGDTIGVASVFQVGDAVRVTGTSKGKGFAGVVKRHGFKGGPRTHGQSDRECAPGSIGQTTTPGRVYRGKRMAGRMGNDTVTVRGLSVVALDAEKNLITVKGVVPGHVNSFVEVTKDA